jgi:hypothetical protein
VKRVLLVMIGLAFSPATPAQDFLQQWRDSATKTMNEFRAVQRPRIEAAGWRFAAGAETAEGVPTADIFVKDLKTRGGKVRSAQVLTASYVPIAAFEVPEYQSTNALVWFDCGTGAFEQRGIERYSSGDGTGPSRFPRR